MKNAIHAIIFLLSVFAAYLAGQRVEKLERELMWQKLINRDNDVVLWHNEEALDQRVKELERMIHGDKCSIFKRLQKLEQAQE